jgi:hypothetical protein
VSVNYLIGVPFPSPNDGGSSTFVPLNAYTYERKFRPVAISGHSMYIYDIDVVEANRVRLALEFPPVG